MNQLAQFTHLHVHSHYTLLGGTASVNALVEQAQQQQLPALALTDTAVLIGAVQFNQACTRAGIQPIIGMTLPIAPLEGELALPTAVAGQLLLLATNPSGYQSLCRLSSAINSQPHTNFRQTGMPWAWLKENRAGLIALDAGRIGWTERYLRAGQRAAAARFASRLAGLFAEQAYLSLELHTPADTAVARDLIAIGHRFGLAAVAAQPIYCLAPADLPRLRLLAAIDQNCPLDQLPNTALPALGDPAVALHWQSPQHIATQFADFPEAVAQVGQIVAQCQPCLPDGRPIWPKLQLPRGKTAVDQLIDVAETGLQQRFDKVEPAYQARLQTELTAINKQGFAPLFLLMADITRFARETAVPINTRGSVANSLVAYCLGISQVDPMAHALLFERFLNPARANLPDIDLDCCSRRRDELLHYIRQTYGAERVALVATISTLQPKSAIRETAKAYGYDEAAIKRLTAVAPSHWSPDPRRRETSEVETIVAQLSDGREQEIVRLAYALVGQPHHLSVHPGGVIITPEPLTDFVPVQLAPKGFLTTQYDFRDVEQIGLPKIDLLGIRALTVLADAAQLIQARHDPSFRLADIPLTDAATAVTLRQAQTVGVFQCESTGAQRTLRQLQTETIRDLAVANAFFKPGPALGGMVQSFIRRYRGQEAVSYLHPSLEPILGQTRGVLLFQEQILRIATEVAGLTWAEADRLRRGMSKFRADEMSAIEARFLAGCQATAGLTPQQAETLWGQVMPFAGYGFNQGHATAYADISYRSAYLKTHYAAEFLCARLADEGGFHHPVIYLAEARRLGLAVRPPHVNVSQWQVTLTDEAQPTLWLGLGQVRQLRRRAIDAIIAQRPYADVRQLVQRVPLQPKELRHLICCGALDGLAASRAALLAEAGILERAGSGQQLALPFAMETAVAAETVRQQLDWETELLGWPVSVHPLALVGQPTAVAQPLQTVAQTRGKQVQIAGVRLPGWTGGKGFYFGDEGAYVVVRPSAGFVAKPERWQPFWLRGIWREDGWGNGWFEAVHGGAYALA